VAELVIGPATMLPSLAASWMVNFSS